MSGIVAPLPSGAIGNRNSCPSSTISATVRGPKPSADALPYPLAVLPAAQLETQLGDFGEFGAFHHRGEVEPLLSGDHRDADVAVLGGLDGRHLERALDRRNVHQLRVQPLAALHQCHRFEHRQVQVFPGSAAPHPVVDRQGTERGECTGHVLPQVAADRDRRPVGIAAEPGAPRPCLQRELGRGTFGPRAGPAEIGHGDDNAPRRHRKQPLGVDATARRARGHHDDVGPSQQIVGKRCDTALSGVQVAEQRRISARRHRSTGDRQAAHQATRGRFHLHDISAGVDKHLAAVVAGDPIADLDDAQIRQRGTGHERLS